MSDTFTVTTSTSWFGRIGASIKSVLVGLVLFALSFPLLWWNEGRAVRTARSLTEGLGAVVSVPAGTVSPGNEGKLVHVSSAVKTDGPVADAALGVEAQAVTLLRKVEMYQWKERERSEKRKKLGGGEETVTTYTYDLEWAEGRIDSESFREPDGHGNPPAPAWSSASFSADPVRVGAFVMSPEQVGMLGGAVDLKLDAAAGGRLPAEAREKLHVADGRLASTADGTAPKPGDVRISFQVIRPSAVSLVGVQTGATFAPYAAKAGDTVLLVEEGTKSAAEMFQVAQSRNATLTWILRGAFFLMMTFGLFLVFRPLAVLADVIPFLGTLLGAGIGIFAFLVALVLSFVTIAIAWVAVRPVLGVSLLVVAAVALVLLVRVGRSRKAARAAAAGADAPQPA